MNRRDLLTHIRAEAYSRSMRAYRLLQLHDWRASGLSQFLKTHEVTLYREEHCWDDCREEIYFDGMKINDEKFFADHPIWDFYDEPLFVQEVPIVGKSEHYKLEAIRD